MNRSRLLATAAAAIGLASAGFVLAAPSIALAEAPQPIGGLTATTVPHGPIVVAPPSLPPSPKGPDKVVQPPFDPPIFPGEVVQPTKPPMPPMPPMPPKPSMPPVPPVNDDKVVDTDPPLPTPTPSKGPSDVTGKPPCPTHGTCGDGTDGGGQPDPSTDSSTDPEYPGGGGRLPITGASVGVVAGLGALLAAGGVLLVILTRRWARLR